MSLVLVLGRLRVQLGGEGWGLELLRLPARANPRVALFIHLGPLTLRWRRGPGHPR